MNRTKAVQDAYTVLSIFAQLDTATKLMVLGYLFALSDSNKIPKSVDEEKQNLSEQEVTQ